MPTEIEIKLRLPGEWAVPPILEDGRVAACLMRDFADTEMDAVYYDTERGELSERQWALRLRRENGVTVAACKVAETRDGPLFSRGEWQVFAEDWETALPLLAAEGAPEKLLSLQSPLVPRCAVKFTRTTAPLRLPDGSTAELALDRGTLSAGNKREDLLELELELLTGGPGGMTELAAYLESRYALSKEYNSKYARALRLLRSRPAASQGG
ncbi:MAG: CYTH domain-containing protein [Oscillospiraceae bacterium]|jgi:inorganic triphosphatase YgiF|nr:CYTH domain-containing protein [Oscillospiraceae bacterium]